jgi:hypothetical protein
MNKTKPSKSKNTQFQLVYWGIILLLVVSILLLIAVPMNSKRYMVSINDSYASARSIFGGYDAGSYLEGALQLLGINESVFGVSEYPWILWPPGMSVTFYLLGTIDLFFKHALLSGVLIQSIAATTILGTLGRFYSKKFLKSFSIVLALILFSPFRDWILGVGLMYGEGPGFAFLVFAFTYMFTKERKIKCDKKSTFTYLRSIVFFGFLISGAAYFRSPIDSLVLMSLPVFFVYLAMSWRNKSQIKVLHYSVFYFSYFLFTLPWRIIANNKFGIPLTRWTGNGLDTSVFYLSNDQLVANSQNAWADGNINWGCILDSLTCGKRSNGSLLDLFVLAIQNPVAFFKIRIPQYFETMGLPGWELYPSNGPVNVLQAILYCCFIVFVTLKSLKVLRVGKHDLSFVLALVFFYGNYVIILFTLFESRYLLISTLMGIVIVIQSNYLLNARLISQYRNP